MSIYIWSTLLLSKHACTVKSEHIYNTIQYLTTMSRKSYLSVLEISTVCKAIFKFFNEHIIPPSSPFHHREFGVWSFIKHVFHTIAYATCMAIFHSVFVTCLWYNCLCYVHDNFPFIICNISDTSAFATCTTIFLFVLYNNVWNNVSC